MLYKSILYQTKKISYAIAGNATGKSVMLLHGFGEDGRIWDTMVPDLEKEYFLLIPDIPGSGQSEFITGADINTYADILYNILQEENIRQCSMIGHSMGGYITLAFAKKYASMLLSFGLFHSTAFADSDEKKEARLKSIEFLQTHSSYAFLKTTTPNLFYNTANPAADALIVQGKTFLPQALIQYYEAMMHRPDRTDVLRTFTKPILFIIGQHDKAVPFASSMTQVHLPAIAHIHILRNAAHMGMLEAEKEAANVLSKFLAGA